MNKKYQAVIFDFFGVVCSEIAPYWFREHLSANDPLQLEQTYVTPADRGDIGFEDVMKNLSRVTRISPQDISKDWQSRVNINKDVVEIIKKLRGDFQTGLLSNSMSTFIRQVLAAYDLECLFKAIVISSEVGLMKPAPEIYNRLLSDLGVGPQQAIFIDDNKFNVKAAQDLGLTGLVFKSAAQLKKDLKNLGVL